MPALPNVRLPLLAAALLLSGCGDKNQPESAAQTAEAPAAKPFLAGEAGRLGMASLLPRDTQFYFGSANLKQHREALQKTHVWKDLEAFINDKIPAGSTRKEGKTGTITPLNVDDFFIAIGKHGADALGWARELNAVYTEYSYLTMMTGYTSGGSGDGKGKGINLDAILSRAASHPDLLERLCAALAKVEIPPLMIGVRTENPDELLKQVIDPAAPPAWLARAAKSAITTPQGNGTAYESTIGDLLNEEQLEDWIANVSKAVTDPDAQIKIKAALTDLAAKKIVLVVAAVDDIAVISLGANQQQLDFAPTPEQSLLARSDFAFAQEHSGKDFAALVFAEGQLVQALQEEQPFTPMLRGALNGLAASPAFGKLAESLRSKVDELAAAERQVHAFTATNAAGVVWWDGGLHLEMSGGYVPQGDALTKPRNFTSLIDTPNALLVADGHSASTGAGRLYFERWMDVIYTAAGELTKAGLGGEQAGAMYPLVDKVVVPALRQMYDASKTVYQQALGSESVLVIDVGGEMPALPIPGMTGPGQKLPMLRVASVHEVRDRALISQSWEKMDLALKQAMQVSPLPMALPSPISSKDNGLVTWFYPLPLASNDLMPCVSLNDDLYILGSSKSLNEELAAQLRQPAARGEPATGTVYRISFKTLRTLLKSLSSTAIPGVKPDAPTTDAVLPWLAPFEDLNARVWQDGVQVRLSASWQMHDVLKYD